MEDSADLVDPPAPSSSILAQEEAYSSYAKPFGVSLPFLHKFLDDHASVISETTTTAEVVYNIIKPETQESQLDYVFAHLLPHGYGKQCLSMNLKTKQMEFSDEVNRSYGCDSTHVKFEFVSHAWSMPFRDLLSCLDRYAVYSKKVIYGMGRSLEEILVIEETVAATMFFWIDVFCKNQHVPAPAMDEFESAITGAGHMLLCFWPAANPLALTRVWCLFEIYSANRLSVPFSISMPENCWAEFKSLHNITFNGNRPPDPPTLNLALKSTGLDFDIENSSATVPSDKEFILGLVHDSVGTEALQEVIWLSIGRSIIDLRVGEAIGDIPCFSGDGLVSMADGSLKLVRDVKAGDVVKTGCGGTAKVQLITRDSLDHTVKACLINRLWITTKHWVRRQGKWVLPKDIAPVRDAAIDALFNFELTSGAFSVFINDVELITLGHDLDIDAASDAKYGHGWRNNPTRVKYSGSN